MPAARCIACRSGDNRPQQLLHLKDWIECIRSRKTPSAPAEAGVAGAGAAHLANQALRSGQTATWRDA